MFKNLKIVLIIAIFSILTIFLSNKYLESLKPITGTRQGLQNQLKNINQENLFHLEVVFHQPIASGDILTMLIPYQMIEVEYLIYKWGDQTGWYFLKDEESIGEALDSFQKRQKELLEGRIRRWEVNGLLMQNTELQLSVNRQLQSFKQQHQYLNENGLVLGGFVAKANNRNILDFLKTASDEGVYRAIPAGDEKLNNPPQTLLQFSY